MQAGTICIHVASTSASERVYASLVDDVRLPLKKSYVHIIRYGFNAQVGKMTLKATCCLNPSTVMSSSKAPLQLASPDLFLVCALSL